MTARLPPTSNLLVSTVAGSRGGVAMSWARRLRAAHQVAAARVDRLLDHLGVGPREVRRGRARRSRSPQRAGRGARRASRPRRRRSARRPSRRSRGSPGAAGGTANCPPRPGRRSAGRPRAGAISERPVRRACSSEARLVARGGHRPGWRARPTPTLTAEPGARKRGGPPAAASASITSRPERAASVVRRTRDGWFGGGVLAHRLLRIAGRAVKPRAWPR